jgi:hypothetical protein
MMIQGFMISWWKFYGYFLVKHNEKMYDHFKPGQHSSNGNSGVKGLISHFQFFEPSTELMHFSLQNVPKGIRWPCACSILKFYFKESKEIFSVSRFLNLAWGLWFREQAISFQLFSPREIFSFNLGFLANTNQWTQDPICHVLKTHLENNCSIQSSSPSQIRNCWKCNFAASISFLVFE